LPLNEPGFTTLTVTCPARIDIGNSLDYPSSYYSLRSQSARTANIAIELRTSISWSPNPRGGISFLTSGRAEHHRALRPGVASRFPMLCALFRHFDIHNGVFHISSEVPRGSGLGGSGMLLVAALALLKCKSAGRISARDWPSIALVAHMFENWLGFSSTGFHDQLAALYGGANTWVWGTHLESLHPFFERIPFSPPGGLPELGKHLLLCFTGQGHRPTRMNRHIGALPAKHLGVWSEVSDKTAAFAKAVSLSDWTGAAVSLNTECDLRRSLDPGCLSQRAKALIEAGRSCGLGCRYAGHGHGGCVWACGPEPSAQAGMERWKALACCWRGAWVIAPKPARRGVIVKYDSGVALPHGKN
jgi:D-glycero-alpha-D-manno-heptose-7-phosphate kinase